MHNSVVANFVEHDGCARLTIIILFVTCVGCLSYTWGYYEGINNSKPLVIAETAEVHVVQSKAAGNDTKAAHGQGMGLHGALHKDHKLHGAGGEKRHFPVHGRHMRSAIYAAPVMSATNE